MLVAGGSLAWVQRRARGSMELGAAPWGMLRPCLAVPQPTPSTGPGGAGVALPCSQAFAMSLASVQVGLGTGSEDDVLQPPRTVGP